MRILVAEDEPRVAAAIARGLRAHGAAVDVALDGAQALFHARVYAYDVLLLDRDLPEVHGDEVCSTLRGEQPGLKILMLTAARSTDAVVEGLALGADDYLGKPFRFGVLEALLRADGAVVSSEQLLESVWDANADPFTNTVRMTLMKLRRKLGEPPVIETIAGAGYRL